MGILIFEYKPMYHGELVSDQIGSIGMAAMHASGSSLDLTPGTRSVMVVIESALSATRQHSLSCRFFKGIVSLA